MKSKIIVLFFIALVCNALNAQEITSYMLIPANYKYQGNKIFIHDMENKGEKISHDIAAKFSKKMNNILNVNRVSNIADKIYNPWLKQFPFYIVEKENDADVVIKSDYSFFTNQDIVTEKIKEKYGSAFQNRLMYSEHVITNQVIFNVNYYIYKDGVEIDAVHFSDTITSNSLGRKPLKSIDILVDKLAKYYSVSDFKPYYEKVNYIFKKVKFNGDKELKAQLKTCKDLLKAGKISEAGAIYKKVFETGGVKEAAFNTGLCYELIGNYEKALVYLKKAPDIFAKKRMEKQIDTYNYLKSIGFEMLQLDF
ncbi:MAG: hypothetical protein K8R41_07565 [Bacteroidales bacterium]|nr:hypothetical protein [Bacteroidales bacterium]